MRRPHIRDMNTLTIAVCTASLLGIVIIGWTTDRAATVTLRKSEGIPPARLAAQGKKVPPIIKCRETPIHVSPRTDLGHLVSDDDLEALLCNAVPVWDPPSVPSLIHELLLWGQHGDFTDEILPGKSKYRPFKSFVVKTLLDYKLCSANTSGKDDDYLYDTPYGIRVALVGSREAPGDRAQGHYGQLLKVLGEAGVTSGSPVRTSSGRIGTVADIIQDSVLRFSLTEELEFIGNALALWLPPQKSWQNEFGIRYDFDQLAEALIAKPFGQGSCKGCHVPYTLVLLLRVDETHSILTGRVRQKSLNWLKALSRLLEERQRSEGGWDESSLEIERNPHLHRDELLDYLTITGHHLEWMSMAPENIRPSDKTIDRAIHGLVKSTRDYLATSRYFKVLLPASHAARAACLMRDVDPFSFFVRARKSGRVRAIESFIR